MKKLLILPLLLGCLALAGCGTVSGTAPAQTLPPEVTNVITQIKDATKAGCKFEPTVATITSVLNLAGVPYVGMVGDLANRFCAAVTKLGAKRGALKMTYKGKTVPIRGKFVR